MDMDLDIWRWILEFLIRNVMDDHLLKQVISTLPLPDNGSLRWKKTMLLRTMDSEILDGSVSENLLDLLEKIAEVDRREGFVVFDTMKSAYCAVAVDCTVRFVEENGNSVGKYFEAVERIWRARIGNLEKSESVDLISDELRSWRDDIEAAVSDDEACKEIITRNTRNQALKTVRAYVTEAWKVMGPTFLEVVAKKMGKSLMESQKLSILPNASLGVCKSNVRDEDLAGERVVNPPDAFQNLGGVSDECAVEDETQAGDRGRTSSGVIDGSTIPAAINENQDERIASPRPNVGGDVGVIDELAKRDKCQVEVGASSKCIIRRSNMKDNDQYGNGASSVHQDLGCSAKPANIDEIHVREIAIPLALIDAYLADVQAKKSKYQVQERASTSFDASRDSAGDRDGVTIFPRHLGGSTEPAITSGNQVEDIVISLPNVGVELNVSDELTKRDKDQVKESAATLCSASEDWGVREGSLIQCGEEAANICQDSGGSSNSAMPVNNQAEQMARLAGAVISDMGSKHMNASHSVDESVEADPRPSLIEETHNRMDANAPNSFFTKNSGAVQGNEDNPGNRCSSQHHNELRPGLLARNGTARTYEWDESIDGSSEGPSTSKRRHLTSPKRRAVSPLKKDEPAKFPGKRKNRRWSNVEEETLRAGVQKYGRGNWKLILNSYPDIFEERTEVNLKDKWRNLTR